jgi:uncharacterized protein (TIRG00374 family)
VNGMVNDEPKATRKHFFILGAGLVVYVIFLSLFVDVGAIIVAIQYANPLYYSLSFFAIVMNMFFHSLTWRQLLETLSIKTSLKKIFAFIWIGSFVDILVPAESVSGEITRAYLMSRDSVNNTGRNTASIMSHRVIYTTMSLFCFVISSLFFTMNYTMTPILFSLTIIILIGALCTLSFLGLLCLKRNLAWKIVISLINFLEFITRDRWNLTQYKPRIQGTLDDFYEGIKTLGNQPIRLVWPILFSILAWTFKMLITFLVFISLSIEVPFSAIVVVFSIIDTLQTVPIGIPGEVGIIDITMTGLFTALGIPPVISATATILTRVVTLWFNLLIGGLFVQWIGVKNITGTLRR